MSLTTVTQNLAGNNPHGRRTGAKRAKAYAAYRLKYPVDVLCVQETTLRSRVLPTLDKYLKPAYRRVGGGKGRYIYARHRLTVIAGGLITTKKKTWYKRDAKHAAWIVHESRGIRGIEVSFHLEHEAAAGRHRLAQMRDIVTQAELIARKYRVAKHNICFAGDANSTSDVPALMALLGYPSAALGTKYEKTSTFHGWDGKASKLIDYIFSPTATLTGITSNTSLSDHASLRATRTLTKEPPMKIHALQLSLKDLGFTVGKVDGITGAKTRGAIHGFQRAWNLGPALTVDGIAGPKTLQAIAKSLDVGKRLSPNFTASELRCKCGGKQPGCLGIHVARADLVGLEHLRAAAYENGLKIVSAYRCAGHNATIPGAASSSQHVKGKAFDIPAKVRTESAAIPDRFKGRGSKHGLVTHIDSRAKTARWKY